MSGKKIRHELVAQSLSGGAPDLGAPFLALAPTLTDLRKGGRRPKHGDLAHVLATIIALHDAGQTIEQFQSNDSVLVAREILDWIGQILARPVLWSATVNAKKAAIAAHKEKDLQDRADAIRRRNPGLSRSAIAKRIDPTRWDVIRKKIKK
jgi:hypothetical protein